jgi:hypothetical protein
MHSSRLGVVLSLSLALVATACGGLTTSDAADGERDDGPGQGGGQGQGQGDGTPWNGACHPYATSGVVACTPGFAAAGVPIDIQALTKECSSADTCEVQVNGAQISLSLSDSGCPAPPGTEQSSGPIEPMCKSSTVACRLPALAAGTYSLTIVGEPPLAPLPPRELVVKAGGETSCTLGAAPSPMPAYATTCTVDEDCALAASGDACSPCTCADGAIAVSELPRYEAARRAATSQCRSSGPGDYGCAPCAAVTPACNGRVCQVRPR